jgi:hypothetical protein
MKGFYQVTTAIKDQLYKDVFVNTVSSGDIFEIEFKQANYISFVTYYCKQCNNIIITFGYLIYQFYVWML